MSATVILLLVAGVLFAAGVCLLLERALSRVLLGVLLLGNAINLLILAMGGPAGAPPLRAATRGVNDPLPQAMILTAIVITLGLTAFLLAAAHRSWQLDGNDDVQDDYEDRRVAVRAARADALAEVRGEIADYRREARRQRAELRRSRREMRARNRVSLREARRRVRAERERRARAEDFDMTGED